ncbi:unnamed protein product, partial [Linum tenue]
AVNTIVNCCFFHSLPPSIVNTIITKGLHLFLWVRFNTYIDTLHMVHSYHFIQTQSFIRSRCLAGCGYSLHIHDLFFFFFFFFFFFDATST